MKIYLRLEAPFEWARVNGQKVEAFGEVPSVSDYPVSADDDVIGIVSGEWVTTHQVTLPAKSRKQFNIALPYALEDSISEEVDNMHFVCPVWKVGEPCNVMVIAKSKMKEWQALANEYRLPISQLVPDFALVPFHDAAECSIALSGDQVLANSQNGVGVSIDHDFLEVWMMDVPVNSTIAVNEQSLTEELIAEHPDRDFRHWPFGNKLAHWLEYPLDLNIDLWSDRFRPSVSRLSLKTFALPALLLALAVIGKMGFDTYRYLALHAEITSIQEESQAVLKSAFAELEFVELGQERVVMEQAISRMGGADRSKSVQAMLAEVSSVLRRQKVTLSNIVFRESELTITCKLNDFSQVDLLTNQLNARPSLQAVLQSSAADDGDIIASYSLRQS